MISINGIEQTPTEAAQYIAVTSLVQALTHPDAFMDRECQLDKDSATKLTTREWMEIAQRIWKYAHRIAGKDIDTSAISDAVTGGNTVPMATVQHLKGAFEIEN